MGLRGPKPKGAAHAILRGNYSTEPSRATARRDLPKCPRA